MRKLALCLAVLLVGVFAGAQQTRIPQPKPASDTAQPQTAVRGNAANGKKLYVSYGCYQCHGYVAQGGIGVFGGPRLAPRPVSFQAFTHQVRHPRNDMPPYTEKVASDQDLADIYAFLLTIPPPLPVSSIPQLGKP